MEYLVTPTHKNGYKAPSILVTTSDIKNPEQDCINKAIEKSNLSKSKDWSFKKVKKLKTRSLSNRKIHG